MANWLPTLTTPTPGEGYDLAVNLERMTVKKSQPDAAVRDRLRLDYALERKTMVDDHKISRPVVSSSEAASGASPDNSLLPMLIVGLVLIVVGAVVVMAFV